MAEHWIKGAIKRPGALHRALGVPQGEKIPAAKLAAAKKSENPRLRRQANLAATLKGMHHQSARRERWYGGKQKD